MVHQREVEVIVISDIHLGTYGCHSKELYAYLKSVKPKLLILNGDIIDIWQFSKSYFPETHLKVIRLIIKYVSEGMPVYYLTGNHDELLRKFTDFQVGSFKIVNKLVLDLDGKKAWFFHGDVFDVTMQYSKWLAKLGAWGYDSLILLNSAVNWGLTLMGKDKMSFSKRIKGRFKDAVKYINSFEETAADLAIEKGYSYVICGHIHQPEQRLIKTEKGEVVYLNSGDWVENLTALEYHYGEWSMYRYDPHHISTQKSDLSDVEDLSVLINVKHLLAQFKSEF
jgi:UDP-2,3-diacylglucosamine pyrophosphatase LpxH